MQLTGLGVAHQPNLGIESVQTAYSKKVVAPLTAGLLECQSCLVKPGRCVVCAAIEPKGAHASVVRQRCFTARADFGHVPQDLGATALNCSQLVVHLKTAVLGRGVAQTV